MQDLDLIKGDPEHAAASESPSDRRRVSRTTGIKSRSPKRASAPRKTAAEKAEEEIASRIGGCIERLADAFENRGDEETATILREENVAMSTGAVSLTRNFKPLRSPLIWLLNLTEPLLSFGRIIRHSLIRWTEWRARKMAEREKQQQEWDRQQAEDIQNGRPTNTPAYQ